MNRTEPPNGDKPGAKPRLVLASGSPQRKRLLEESGYRFDVIPPADSAEAADLCTADPVELVTELAVRKAQDVAIRFKRGWIVAADTIAERRGAVLGKPRDEAHARAMLGELSGEEHRVLTGICVQHMPSGRRWVRVAQSRLRMETLTPDDLDAYVRSGQWRGKAGAFGYQDRLGWIHILEGSESNVIGLPMEMLGEMLAEAGYYD